MLVQVDKTRLLDVATPSAFTLHISLTTFTARIGLLLGSFNKPISEVRPFPCIRHHSLSGAMSCVVMLPPCVRQALHLDSIRF